MTDTDTMAASTDPGATFEYVDWAIDTAEWELSQDLDHKLEVLLREANGLVDLTEYYKNDRSAANRGKLVHQLNHVKRLRAEFDVDIDNDIDIADTEATQAFYARDAVKAQRAAQRGNKLRRLKSAVKAFFAKLWRGLMGTDIVQPTSTWPAARQLHKSQFKSVTPTPAVAVAPEPNPVPVAN